MNPLAQPVSSAPDQRTPLPCEPAPQGAIPRRRWTADEAMRIAEQLRLFEDEPEDFEDGGDELPTLSVLWRMALE